MAITKRGDKGSALTYTEMDDNFDAIAPRTSANGAIQIPAGTTSEQPASPQSGQFRYNTTSNTFEGYSGGVWGAIGSGGGGGGQTNQNAWSEFIVAGQSTVAADQATDSVTIVAGTNMSITTDAGADSITFNASFNQDFAYSSLTGAPAIPNDLLDLGITDGSPSQVLSTDGSGNFTFVAQTGGGSQGVQGISGLQGPLGTTLQGTQGFTGPSGSDGSDGSDGDPGIQGPAGSAQGTDGNQGVQGLRGNVGFGTQGIQGPAAAMQGTQGIAGDQGDPGDLGNQGTQGVAGSVQGIQGPGGLQGEGGFDGQPGFQGLQGPAGDAQGVQGIQGDDGPPGAGSQGIQGVQGDDGPPGFGNQGVQGVQGLPSDLQGVQGPPGEGSQGIQGPAGSVQGLQGLQGRDGVGDTGAQGIQGTSVQGLTGGDGIQGAQGTQGVQSLQGIQGESITGPDGIQGPTGVQGDAGVAGLQGFEGAATQGLQGMQGTEGSGNQGVQGIEAAGAQGAQGAQGTSFQGIQGSEGPVGVGIQGVQGDFGGQGVQGPGATAQGIQGIQGWRGFQGIQGTDLQGVQGTAGVGTQGVTGATGTGVQGPQGTFGIQGVQGIPSASDLVLDLTPQLGGNLDINSKKFLNANPISFVEDVANPADISTDANIQINLEATDGSAYQTRATIYSQNNLLRILSHDRNNNPSQNYVQLAIRPTINSGVLQLSSVVGGAATNYEVTTEYNAMTHIAQNMEYLSNPVRFNKIDTTARDALTFQAEGNMIYNTTTDQVEIYNGSGWENLINAVTGETTIDGDVTIDNGNRLRLANTGVDKALIGLTGGTYLYMGSEGTNSDPRIRFDGESTQAAIVPTLPAGAVTAGASGYLNLGSSTSGFKDLYLDGGVYLGGTGAANHLDDYEEGTFTPTLITSTGTVSYTVQLGWYRKVGSLVFIAVDVVASNTAGAILESLASFPFTIGNTSGFYPGPAIANAYNIDLGTGGTALGGYWVNGETRMRFHSYGNNTNQLTPSISSSGTFEIRMTGFFSI